MTWRENIERVREGHAKAMEALGADVHPYSGPAIRDWEAQHDAALAGLTAQMEELEAALRPFASGDWTLPERGVGTAWATMHCPFCDFMGPADKWVATLEANHDTDCPILVARHALAQSDPPEDSE